MKQTSLLLTLGLLAVLMSFPQVFAAVPQYAQQPAVNVAPAAPHLTAVDPYAYVVSTDVMPARPFLYSVDNTGITITRFNDNRVVGRWLWPTDVIYTVLPNGSFTGLTPPKWEPVAMTVSYPTEAEIANRVKEIPDLTPPPTYVYVVMAHSGYEWKSIGGLRNSIVPATSAATESSMLVQIDVSDPSFSAALDPANPVPPHVAAALLGHGAGQPVYDRSTGSVYVGNMPSTSLPVGLTSFVSVIRRIPPEVAEVEAEVPGISIPVIRCGPQHPEAGIPVGKPQAWACYDPSGVHPIDDNEHAGASGEFEWEFQNLPVWLTAHKDKATGKLDGILYGTPTATGEWYAEARVHNLDDPYGVFSEWTPVRLLVTPGAEYLPIKAQFAAGVPVAYPLEGAGSCAVTGAPAWVDAVPVLNGCIVMGRAPFDGEHYNFQMSGFTPAGYALGLTFSGDVFGGYEFVPVPEGVSLSGMGWHQVSKVADPSTETPVLSLEFIAVESSTGQLYRILPPPGKPQPPNARPPETQLTPDIVTALGTRLDATLLGARTDIAGHLVGFGQVAVEADRDIFVGAITDSTVANGAIIKVNAAGTPSVITLSGVQAYWLDLDSDLRTAIKGVEPGQVDHGALWVTGTTTHNAAVVDTATGAVSPITISNVASLGSVSVDFGTRFVYVAGESTLNVAVLAPTGAVRPRMEPRIWSAEEFTWNLGQAGEVHLMATGDAVPALSLTGTIPPGLTFVNNGDGTATISGTPTAAGGGGGAGGELDVEGGDYAMVVTAKSTTGGIYAQAFGITVQSPPKITSVNSATFVAGSASSFTVTGTGWPTPIFYIWDTVDLPVGVQLIDNENGTSSLIGTPAAAGTYHFKIYATTDCPPDAVQDFTLTVLAAGQRAPVFTSPNATTWESVGDPFPPDPFTITTTGSPTPSFTATGLPTGVTFTDNGNSTATLGGTPVAVGTSTITITAKNAAGIATQTFTLVVEKDTTLLGALPATLSFTSDGTFVPWQTVALTTGGDTLPYALVTTENWLSATAVSGMMPGNITVSANAAGLAPGTYTGTVIINSAGTEGPPAIVTVTLTVIAPAAPGTLGLWPAGLKFDYNATTGPVPAPQMVWVMSGGAHMPYTVSTGGAKWLTAPAGGTAPGGFKVSVDPRLGVGMHVATLTVTAGGKAQTIPVTLVKTAGNSDLIKVMFAVGDSPEGLTINRTTHHLFLNSATEPAGGGGDEASETSPAPPDSEPPAPSSVFHVDPAKMTVVAEIVVHSEGEYIAANSKTGRVYHASQGTGEIAVVDGSANKVLTYIPLTGAALDGRQGAFQPYQIAIDEVQNIIYVGAKAPPITDPPVPSSGVFPCKAIHEMPDDEYDCWNPGKVFVIDGKTNQVVSSFFAGDDPEGVVFAAATKKVYASNEDDGSVTVAKGAVRNPDGSITPAVVLSTIIKGAPVAGWWKPKCDANNYCGERGQAALWPTASLCAGKDDEAEEADKMAVDPAGNVYIIDDRYRVAKIDGQTDHVHKVLAIPGFDCELEVPDGTEVLFRNTANNIAYMALGKGKLYVTSEQNTITLIDPVAMTIKATLTIPGAMEFDAITTDPGLNTVYITDEGQPALWMLKGSCANGTGNRCVQ